MEITDYNPETNENAADIASRRIIGTSPAVETELLEAGKAIRDIAQEFADTTFQDWMRDAVNKYDAVVAKATGEGESQ